MKMSQAMTNPIKSIASVLYGAVYLDRVMHFIDQLLFTPLVPELIGAIFPGLSQRRCRGRTGMGLCVSRTRPYASPNHHSDAPGPVQCEPQHVAQ